MNAVKKLIPRPIRSMAITVRRMMFYRTYDSSAYWRQRASEKDQAAVLWQNPEYNDLYRADQRAIMEPWIRALPPGASVLDIGCGIGVVAAMIRSMRDDIRIDAVDFEEMIAVAREKNSGKGINYIASSAEEFINIDKNYDIIISSGCYSAIRDIGKLESALTNGARMIEPGGAMLMIDPFHRWNYLARAKYGTKDVIHYLKPLGLSLVLKSGVLFWPYRVRLANSSLRGEELQAEYAKGEAWLKRLGRHFWADYKILVFRKRS